MKLAKIGLTIGCLLPLAAIAAEPAYTTPAPADSGCKVYDVSNIISSIDLNKDGKLSKEEWTQVTAPPSSYQMIEKDKKGYITPQEFVAVSPPGGIDANKDCKLTLDEMKAMEKNPPAGGPPSGAPPKTP